MFPGVNECLRRFFAPYSITLYRFYEIFVEVIYLDAFHISLMSKKKVYHLVTFGSSSQPQTFLEHESHDIVVEVMVLSFNYDLRVNPQFSFSLHINHVFRVSGERRGNVK